MSWCCVCVCCEFQWIFRCQLGHYPRINVAGLILATRQDQNRVTVSVSRIYYSITIWLQQNHTETSLYSSKGDLQTDHCLKQIQTVRFNRRHLHTRKKPTGTPSKWRASPISTGRGLSLGGDRWWRAGQSHPVKKPVLKNDLNSIFGYHK